MKTTSKKRSKRKPTIPERVTVLEVNNHELMGNGQPGIIHEIRNSVEKLRNAFVVYLFVDLCLHFASSGNGAALQSVLKFLFH